ncbi:MAG: pentapeptide repeat-containing protein [Planctomycetota bacterium]
MNQTPGMPPQSAAARAAAAHGLPSGLPSTLPPDVLAALAAGGGAAGKANNEDEVLERIHGDKPVTGSTIAGFDFNGRDLTDANLLAVELNTVSLENASMLRVNLAWSLIVSCSMKRARLQHADFTGATISSVIFEDADASHSRWMRAHLPRVRAARIRLDHADLSESVMIRTDLNGARMEGARLVGSRLDGAMLTGAELRGCDLTGCVLAGADLRGARLIDCKLHHVVLIGADCTNCDFTGCDFDDVNMEAAQLQGCKLPERMQRTWLNLAARQHPLALYQRAVQSVPQMLDVVSRLYSEHAGKPLHHLREDFAAAGAYAISWARRDEANHGYGVELDPLTIAWGLTHNAADFDRAARKRIHMIEGNVLDPHQPKVEAICAFNSSWCVFKDDETLQRYFNVVHESLEPSGLFILDVFGGPALERAGSWPTEHPAFTYHWQHESFDPATRSLRAHMHFAFPDGSKLEKAFTYDWRVWTLEEVESKLKAAGFDEVARYAFERGPGNRETETFARVTDPPNPAAWSVYVVAFRKGAGA